MNERSEVKNVPLDEIFRPRGIAVVGVSASKLAFAELVVHALKGAGYPAIYPVNPKYTEVLGLACYPSVKAIPGAVDHVVVNIPAESVLRLLDECAEKGVKSVHFFTAGFGESGYQDRAELETEMLARARAGGFRIIGPNCVGLYVPRSRVVNHFDDPLEPGPIAFLSQSGGHAQNIPYHSRARGLRFSKVVSYGNALDVNESELLHYFAEDPETGLIGAYIEGVKDGARFRRALGHAASRKPVVVYKGGRTEAGRRAAHGHTASMTSSVAVFDALCRQANAIAVEDLDEMIDVLAALRFMKPLPAGRGVALIGAGGGPSVLAGDRMEREGLRLPGFSAETQEALRKRLPMAGSIFSNPLDTPNLATAEAVSVAVEILGRAPEVDLLVYHLGFHPISRWGMGRISAEEFLKPTIEAMKETVRVNARPVLLALRPAQDLNGMKEFLSVQEAFVQAGLPVFHSMRRLARSVARVLAWHRRTRSGG
jgi:acetyltransferase